MIDPNEPLTRGVYLRRRIVAVLAVVGGVVVLSWVITGLLGHDEGLPGRNAAVQVHSSAPPTPSTGPTASSSSTAPPTQPTSPVPTSSAPPPAPAPPPPPPPDPNLPCPDQVVAVTAEMEPVEFRAGVRPQLRLVVVNTGAVPCTRDLGRAQRELVISGGGARLWSSNDCVRTEGSEPTILVPGQRQVFDVRWAGRTSAPGCPTQRSTVQAGDYVLTPRLGGLSGPGVAFAVRP
ncbi:hypothetical protein V5P93_000467 [Actinokineospora auranticolor]|uniref:MucR family transcriptional regulator n=1 Tax=Actinokineospora auranticolor TaxID=155976 RepID=A0A2S6GE26_9PSEU|nr:hypothetical protein [Actinokineospora auranticolor]PPK63479.1 hypothetical protein CLV40_1276 [Actinokineospora auranticolor]